MSINVTCSCGSVYNLKDEYAGSQVACPKCSATISVPALPPAPPVKAQDGDSAFARNKFLLNQRHLAIKEKYSVADEEGNEIMYVERPRYLILSILGGMVGMAAGFAWYLGSALVVHGLKGSLPPALYGLLGLVVLASSVFVIAVVAMALSKKRHISIYRDDSKGEPLLQVLQDFKIQILTSSFTIADPEGNPIATIYKKYLHNILRKRWYCVAPDGNPLFVVKEDSMILSILRRFLGSFFGLLRTDFIFFDADENVLGEFNRRMTLLDRYVLDMSADSLRKVDRRVALATGVLLDTGEKR
ncbi:MAG TPA: hypothetical protein DCZ92_00670 [Elusimicrobia bacterium]|nr:MAG: hypothetical protein A2016_09975 [Elusimicrobia bacterium GWF2_62_30]HBA59339.1 hypothetical protein [Elusimicrobiota bacterium]